MSGSDFKIPVLSQMLDFSTDLAGAAAHELDIDTGRESPQDRNKRKAKSKAARAKLAARKRLKPIPDPEATKSEARKKAARSRASRQGRASTMLSDSAEKLG